MAQPAYNLETFENREPRVRVKSKPVQKRKPKRINWAPVKKAAVAVVFLALLFSVLYSNAQITQLTADIAVKQNELTNLKSEYDYLDTVMQANASVRTVEEYATTQLGLAKIDSNQVVYITLTNESRVEMVNNNNSVWGYVEQTFLTVMEYFAA